MRHFWVFETLLDLRDYALENRFPRTAEKLGEAIATAMAEIDPRDPGARDPSETPPQG